MTHSPPELDTWGRKSEVCPCALLRQYSHLLSATGLLCLFRAQWDPNTATSTPAAIPATCLCCSHWVSVLFLPFPYTPGQGTREGLCSRRFLCLEVSSSNSLLAPSLLSFNTCPNFTLSMRPMLQSTCPASTPSTPESPHPVLVVLFLPALIT